MIYKFKSKAAADLIMTAPVADRMLTLIGKEPAAKGIIEVAELSGALQALERAVSAESPQGADQDDDAGGADGASGDSVSLRRRMWPMVEMMKRSLAGNEPIVWGV